MNIRWNSREIPMGIQGKSTRNPRKIWGKSVEIQWNSRENLSSIQEKSEGNLRKSKAIEWNRNSKHNQRNYVHIHLASSSFASLPHPVRRVGCHPPASLMAVRLFEVEALATACLVSRGMLKLRRCADLRCIGTCAISGRCWSGSRGDWGRSPPVTRWPCTANSQKRHGDHQCQGSLYA